MMYSIIGILAIAVLFITNWDVIWKRGSKEFTPTYLRYRSFLFGILFYYITDVLWGFLDDLRLTGLLFAETSLYFVAMATALLLWTRYAVAYLENEKTFGRMLYLAGRIVFVLQLVSIAVNLFYPLLFWFDEAGAYHAGVARYVTLAVQILMFLLTSVYTLRVAFTTEGMVRSRHLTIGAFGIAMVILVAIQIAYPLLPLYSIGYMLGSCVLHSFVLEGEKEEYRSELEKSLERERIQKQELSDSRETLKDALASAEEANRAKTAFLSNMSHEIRTPMNAIIGLNSIALNEPTASEPVKEYLMKIDASARYLLGIINDILDMSRIEAGCVVIRNEEFSFAKCLEQVNTIIGGQCRDKGLNYECHMQGTIDNHYVGDAMKLKQVLVNTLGNSVKFTPEGGTVSFVIEEGPRYDGQATLRFIISDNGIGMSEEFLPHLFDSFSQEDSSSTKRYGSTGLGMPITKSLVELMNGHIEVESEKNVGTTFTITVTLGESKLEEAGTQDGDIKLSDMKVLVIDDDPIALEHAQVVFGQIGISCDTAGSGAEALKMVELRHARREEYNMILVDWRMEGMDGVETTRKVRDVVGEETPIIILTSFNWDDIADDAKAAGVDTFVSKPLFSENVLNEFREAMRRKSETPVEKRADLKGRHILLAEDVSVNAEIMVMILSMREMEADVAVNGKVAIDMYNENPEGYYDAILMDVRMPEMDGLEATAAIRASDRADAKTIPIIALTANAFDEDVQRSLQAGLNAHLSKPVDPEVLFDTLEKLIHD